MDKLIKNYDKFIDLMDKFQNSNMTSMEINDGDFHVKFDKNTENPVINTVIKEEIKSEPTMVLKDKKSKKNSIKSPIVGTFYQAPSVDSKPFVTAGSNVKKGDVLCIVEAMKVMNEITAEFDCKIKEILVSDGDVVGFGQDLFIYE